MRTRWRGRAVTSSSRPDKWCGCPAVTRTPAQRAGCRCSGTRRREVQQLPLAGARRQHGGVAPAHAFDKHFLAAPDTGLVPGQGRAVDDRLESFEALGDDLGRDELGLHGRGPRPGTRRENEGVGAVVAGLRAYGQRVLEVLGRLAGEADDDVRGHSEIVDRLARRGEPFEVARCAIAAAHGAQHTVAARLEWQVELLAHLGRRRHGLDRLGPQVLRVRAGEADPPDSLDGTDRAQELGEERSPPRDVAAVGVDVLSEQRDLGDATARQQLDLGHDVVEWAAHLGAPHGGHDAKGARVVAAGLDVDPRRIGQLAHGAGTEQGVGARLGRRRVKDLHERAFGPRPLEQTRRAGEVVRAKDHVDPADLLLNQLTVLLRQATADGDLQSGLRFDQLFEPAEGAVETLICVLPDAAGVEDDHVCVILGGDRRQALADQQPREPLGVVLVHLAPEGTDEEGARHEPSVGSRGA